MIHFFPTKFYPFPPIGRIKKNRLCKLNRFRRYMQVWLSGSPWISLPEKFSRSSWKFGLKNQEVVITLQALRFKLKDLNQTCIPSKLKFTQRLFWFCYLYWEKEARKSIVGKVKSCGNFVSFIIVILDTFQHRYMLNTIPTFIKTLRCYIVHTYLLHTAYILHAYLLHTIPA